MPTPIHEPRSPFGLTRRLDRAVLRYGGVVDSDEVLQQEELDVSVEALEQVEEVAVPRQRLTERAGLAFVVPADAFERQVEPARDRPETAAHLVDGPLALDLVSREDDEAADAVCVGFDAACASSPRRATRGIILFQAEIPSLESQNSPSVEW